MGANNSADKSRAELWRWQQTDPGGLVNYTFELQAEVRRLRDRAAQNSRNTSRPPSTDGAEPPKPKSLRKPSGRQSVATRSPRPHAPQLRHAQTCPDPSPAGVCVR